MTPKHPTTKGRGGKKGKYPVVQLSEDSLRSFYPHSEKDCPKRYATVHVKKGVNKGVDPIGDSFSEFLESQGHKVVDVTPSPKVGRAYCSECKSMDDDMCDCEHCGGTGFEPSQSIREEIAKIIGDFVLEQKPIMDCADEILSILSSEKHELIEKIREWIKKQWPDDYVDIIDDLSTYLNSLKDKV